MVAAGLDPTRLADAYSGELGIGAEAVDLTDEATGVLFALTSTFLTGQTLHIDGGEPLT